jgi:hypothetical protein
MLLPAKLLFASSSVYNMLDVGVVGECLSSVDVDYAKFSPFMLQIGLHRA